MKNKNEKKEILVWQKANSRQWRWSVALIFVLASFFSWWFLVSFSAAAWKSSLWYDLEPGQKFSSTGAAAATAAEAVVEQPFRYLDGKIISSGDINRVPYAVMIENLLSVRPQSGLSRAAVVYEALVEGGATRFMAVFDPSENIPEIMPVRSARPYYLEWVSEYGALYAHAGGSPKALTVIWENPDINNLEALSSDGKYFWRDTSRSAPHNLVTSSEKMNFALRDKELAEKAAAIQPWIFKDEAPLSERGEDAKTISFNFSYGATYKVDYTYNQETNIYLRFNANQPHTDRNTGEQIAVKNVVIQLTEEPVLDGGKGRLDIYVGGTGKAWVFRDGQVIEGSWKKESRTGRTRFYNLDGQEIEFNRGNTWVSVITKTQEVTYE